MSPMCVAPTWFLPSGDSDGVSSICGGRVATATGVKSSSVRDSPPCHEKYQPCPSVVTPCERMSVSCQRNVSEPTCFQVVQTAPASPTGTTNANRVSKAMSDRRDIHENNGSGAGYLQIVRFV